MEKNFNIQIITLNWLQNPFKCYLTISFIICIYKYVNDNPKLPQILYNNSLYCFAMLYVCRPRSPLTIPDAMLFAKLTLCSHGNESCRDKKRERWIAGLVYNHTIIQPSVTARYAVREMERKSLHNGSRLLQTQITHTQTQLLKTL